VSFLISNLLRFVDVHGVEASQLMLEAARAKLQSTLKRDSSSSFSELAALYAGNTHLHMAIGPNHALPTDALLEIVAVVQPRASQPSLSAPSPSPSHLRENNDGGEDGANGSSGDGDAAATTTTLTKATSTATAASSSSSFSSVEEPTTATAAATAAATSATPVVKMKKLVGLGAVLCNWTLHFIPDPCERMAYLASLFQALAPGGVLVLTDKTLQSPLERRLYHEWKMAPPRSVSPAEVRVATSFFPVVGDDDVVMMIDDDNDDD
jgi:hypothetical protein